MKTSHLVLAPLVLAPLALGLMGCSTTPEKAFNSPAQEVQLKRLADGSFDDQSKCEWRNRQDRESIETAGPGSVMPNVRRVFAIVGQGTDRQRVLICREIDTNLDGAKDVVRKFNDKGERLFEESDTNYDGKIDTWLTFGKSGLAEAKLDNNYDGNPDEWKFFSGGKLTRARRDTNHDSKPDVWEMYGPTGILERMGVDVDGDERVDRWDYDTDIRKGKEAAANKEEADAAQKASEKLEAERKAGEYATAEEGADGEADSKTKKKKDQKPAAKKAKEQPKPAD